MIVMPFLSSGNSASIRHTRTRCFFVNITMFIAFEFLVCPRIVIAFASTAVEIVLISTTVKGKSTFDRSNADQQNQSNKHNFFHGDSVLLILFLVWKVFEFCWLCKKNFLKRSIRTISLWVLSCKNYGILGVVLVRCHRLWRWTPASTFCKDFLFAYTGLPEFLLCNHLYHLPAFWITPYRPDAAKPLMTD